MPALPNTQQLAAWRARRRTCSWATTPSFDARLHWLADDKKGYRRLRPACRNGGMAEWRNGGTGFACLGASKGHDETSDWLHIFPGLAGHPGPSPRIRPETASATSATAPEAQHLESAGDRRIQRRSQRVLWQATLNGCASLVRWVVSVIAAASRPYPTRVSNRRIQQTYSADGSKAWKANWIATDPGVAPGPTTADRAACPAAMRTLPLSVLPSAASDNDRQRQGQRMDATHRAVLEQGHRPTLATYPLLHHRIRESVWARVFFRLAFARALAASAYAGRRFPAAAFRPCSGAGRVVHADRAVRGSRFPVRVDASVWGWPWRWLLHCDPAATLPWRVFKPGDAACGCVTK